MNTTPTYSSNTSALEESKVKQPGIPVLGQVMGWGMLIAIYFIYQAYVTKDVFTDLFDFFIFIGYSMGLFYFNVLFLIPAALKHTRYALHRLLLYTALEMIAIVVFLVFISLALGGMELHWDGSFSKVNIINFAGLLFIVFFGLLVSWAYYMVMWGLKQKAKSERKKTRNEVLMYQNKIHELDKMITNLPTHFVLNTLILLRFTVEHEPLIGSRCFRCFSEIMRFYSDTSLNGFIPIDDELMQLIRYKELHEIRMKTHIHFEINREGQLSGVRILPMILLTLAENIVKYGVLLDATKPAQISVGVADDLLVIKAENWINKFMKVEYSSGRGLHSVKERLLHFYPIASSFRAERYGDCYEVEICIPLNSSCS